MCFGAIASLALLGSLIQTMGEEIAIESSNANEPRENQGDGYPLPSQWEETVVLLPQPIAPRCEKMGYCRHVHEDRVEATAEQCRRKLDEEYNGRPSMMWALPFYDDENPG